MSFCLGSRRPELQCEPKRGPPQKDGPYNGEEKPGSKRKNRRARGRALRYTRDAKENRGWVDYARSKTRTSASLHSGELDDVLFGNGRAIAGFQRLAIQRDAAARDLHIGVAIGFSSCLTVSPCASTVA